MTEESISSLIIESLNVNSIGQFNKRNQVFNHLKKRKTHIHILVDTRIDPKNESVVKTEWGGPAFFSSFSSNQRGVAILFDKGVPIKVLKTTKDDNGNFLKLIIEYDSKKILLGGVYGPNQDSPDFYRNIVFHEILNDDPDQIILAGDFNLVLNQDLDTLNYLHENNINARNTVIECMANNNLIDIWRSENPDEKKFTWFQKKCAKSFT